MTQTFIIHEANICQPIVDEPGMNQVIAINETNIYQMIVIDETDIC